MTDSNPAVNSTNVNTEIHNDSSSNMELYEKPHTDFTKVSCGEVYAFSSIATSGDFSGSVQSLTDMIQLGVEITYPNGKTELLVFQPNNLTATPLEYRVELVDNLFNNGTIWIGQYSSVFTPAGFPKTWDTLVVPDSNSVKSIADYLDNSYFQYSPESKKEAIEFGGVLSLGLGSSAIGFVGAFANIGFLALPIIVIAGMYGFGDSVMEKIHNKLDINVPRMWMQQMDISDEELEDCTPVNDTVISELTTVMKGVDGKWTTCIVKDITKNSRTTVLELETNQSEVITIEYSTPVDPSHRFTLNKICDELECNTIQDLEGKCLELGLSSLGTEDNVSKNNLYRIRVIE